MLVYVLCYRVCFLQHCGHLLGKGWPFDCHVCCVFLCAVTFPNVPLSTSEFSQSWLCETSLSPPVKVFLLTIPRWSFFCAWYCYLYFVSVLFSGLFIAAWWSPAWEGWPLGSLVCDVLLCPHFWKSWRGILLLTCPCVGASVRASVTKFIKIQFWNFIYGFLIKK